MQLGYDRNASLVRGSRYSGAPLPRRVRSAECDSGGAAGLKDCALSWDADGSYCMDARETVGLVCHGRKRNVATLKPALGKQACTATCKASRQRAITGASPSSSAWALCRLEKMGGLPMYAPL